jgi:hypothetical protein
LTTITSAAVRIGLATPRRRRFEGIVLREAAVAHLRLTLGRGPGAGWRERPADTAGGLASAVDVVPMTAGALSIPVRFTAVT